MISEKCRKSQATWIIEEICRFRVGALTQRPIVSNANNNGGTPFLSEKLGAFLSEELGVRSEEFRKCFALVPLRSIEKLSFSSRGVDLL